MTGPTVVGPPPGPGDIVAAIEEEIVSGRWPTGFRLPAERRLAQVFSVSRPVLREALRSLAERGLIAASPGRGSFVQQLSASSAGGAGNVELLARRGEIRARDLVVARTMLESEAARLAAANRSDVHVAEMRELLVRFERSSGPATADLDLAFHEAIAIASGNPVIQVMFGAIRALTHGIMLRSLTDREVSGAALPLHTVVLDAIERGDAQAAGRAMADHVGAAARFYGSDLDLPLAEVLRARADVSPAFAGVLREVSASIGAAGPRQRAAPDA